MATLNTYATRRYKASLQLLLSLLLFWPVLAVAASGTNIFSEIRLEQKLGEPLPLELTFRNESGKAVAL